MIGRVKKWLGIEGVKLEIIAPDAVDKKDEIIFGTIRLQSLNPQLVNRIKVVLIEKYARGKGQDKLVDEYELGSFEHNELIEIPAEGTVEIPFQLPFRLYKSKVDEFGEGNAINRLLVSGAKWIRGVKSAYRIEAEAKVKGVMLNPFDRKNIDLS